MTSKSEYKAYIRMSASYLAPDAPMDTGMAKEVLVNNAEFLFERQSQIKANMFWTDGSPHYGFSVEVLPRNSRTHWMSIPMMINYDREGFCPLFIWLSGSRRAGSSALTTGSLIFSLRNWDEGIGTAPRSPNLRFDFTGSSAGVQLSGSLEFLEDELTRPRRTTTRAHPTGSANADTYYPAFYLDVWVDQTDLDPNDDAADGVTLHQLFVKEYTK